jgi:hypothetical protein
MTTSAKSADAMLAAAARMRRFAFETGMQRYQAYFHRGARDLELEAVGCAASGVVARAIRDLRLKRRREEISC